MLIFKSVVDGGVCYIEEDRIIEVEPYKYSGFLGSRILLDDDSEFIVRSSPEEVMAVIEKKNDKQIGWYSPVNGQLCNMYQKERYPDIYHRYTTPVYIKEE